MNLSIERNQVFHVGISTGEPSYEDGGGADVGTLPNGRRAVNTRSCSPRTPRRSPVLPRVVAHQHHRRSSSAPAWPEPAPPPEWSASRSSICAASTRPTFWPVHGDVLAVLQGTHLTSRHPDERSMLLCGKA